MVLFVENLSRTQQFKLLKLLIMEVLTQVQRYARVFARPLGNIRRICELAISTGPGTQR